MTDFNEALERVLFVGGHGYVVAVDKESGDEIWRTNLKGSGYGFVNILFEDNKLFAASGGKLFSLDPNSGAIQWTNGMSGLGYGIYSVTTAQSASDPTAAIRAQMRKSENSGQSGSH